MTHTIEPYRDLSAGARREAYDRWKEDPTLVTRLIEGLEGPAENHEVASWFLKHHVDREGSLCADEVREIYRLARTLDEWPALLHILQILPRIAIPEASVEDAEALLRRCLDHPNKFVRAWAYGGFHFLAAAYPLYEAESKELIEAALRDEAPSVKARIRNALQPRLRPSNPTR